MRHFRMAYLIRTDTKNLLESIQNERIRIPRRQKYEADLRRIKQGDSIFLYDYERRSIHGPVLSRSSKVIEEKNPGSGPFNGSAGGARCFVFDSIEVDCSNMFDNGFPIVDTMFNPDGFYIIDENEELLISTLSYFNTRTQPLIINILPVDDSLHVTIVELNEGAEVSNRVIGGWGRLREQIQDMKRTGEDALCRNNTAYRNGTSHRNGTSYRDRDAFDVLTEIGISIYERFIAPLGLEMLHAKGGYRIYISGTENTFGIPFELSWDNEFMFEKNIISYTAGKARSRNTVELKRILIIADPSGSCAYAYREGTRLYNYFLKSGFYVDLLSRPLQNFLLAALLSEYDLVHFCGHHGSGKADAGWELGCSTFSAGDLGMVRFPPSLVFSSACGCSMGLGYGMIQQGVGNAISSRWTIPDRDMGDFCISFYKTLFNTMDIGYSFNRAVRDAFKRRDLTPLAFVLQGESRMKYEKKDS